MRAGFMRSRSSSSSSKPATSAWYQDAFDTYADPDEGKIDPSGIEKLCAGLEVEPTDVLVLVLAWQLGAAQMGYFSKEEWESGGSALGSAGSLPELLERLGHIYSATRNNMQQLRELHVYTHKCYRALEQLASPIPATPNTRAQSSVCERCPAVRRFCREERKKTIDVGSAVAMLQLLHGDAYPKHVPHLAEFLQAHESACKRGVSYAIAAESPRLLRLLDPCC